MGPRRKRNYAAKEGIINEDSFGRKSSFGGRRGNLAHRAPGRPGGSGLHRGNGALQGIGAHRGDQRGEQSRRREDQPGPGCTYRLTAASNTDPMLGATGLPVITSRITLDGFHTTIAGNNSTFRILL